MNRSIASQVGSCGLLISGLVHAQPAAPSPNSPSAPVAPAVCDESWFEKAADQVPLTPPEMAAICDSRNATLLTSKMQAACPTRKAEFDRARSKLCKAFPSVRASAEFVTVARTYHAAGEPLASVVANGARTKPDAAPGEASPTANGQARAEALTTPVPVSVIAQGVGDFLVKRAEQELSAYATVEVFRRVCEAPGDQWFPKTCVLLKGAEVGTEPIGLGVLRRALTADLEHLPKNVIEEVLPRLSPQQVQTACYLDVGYALVTGIEAQGSITPLFKFEADGSKLVLQRYEIGTPRAKEKCGPTWAQLTSAFKPASEVLKSYREALRVTSPAAAEGLAEQNVMALAQGANRIDLGEVLRQYEVLAQALEDIRNGKDSKAASETAVRASFGMLEALLAPVGDAAAQRALDEVAALGVAITQKDWIGVVSAAASAETLGPILLCKRASQAGCALDHEARSVLTLIADIAAAESSDGVSAAVERFAEPIGSWRRKHERFTMGLNGYVGLKGAREVLVSDTQPGWITAPLLALGVDFSGPISESARLGAFIQLVDIGNVANVRFASDDDPNLTKVNVAPDIEVVQLFAPGVYGVLAPFKSPFVLLAGANWVPQLRSAETGPKSVWQIGAALAVDVPLLELVH